MNSVILVCLAACVYLANAEVCQNDADCSNGFTKCSTGHALSCHETLCYCEPEVTQNATNCTLKSDCTSNGVCHGGRGSWHCVDAKCRCFYF